MAPISRSQSAFLTVLQLAWSLGRRGEISSEVLHLSPYSSAFLKFLSAIENHTSSVPPVAREKLGLFLQHLPGDLEIISPPIAPRECHLG